MCLAMLTAADVIHATNLPQASPLLTCEIEHTGVRRTITQAPVSDPYRVVPVDIDERFRFKAVVLVPSPSSDSSAPVAPGMPDYIALYTYYWQEGVPKLLHEAKYRQPTLTPPGSSLTGRVSVYAPPLGRELSYACTLGVAP